MAKILWFSNGCPIKTCHGTKKYFFEKPNDFHSWNVKKDFFSFSLHKKNSQLNRALGSATKFAFFLLRHAWSSTVLLCSSSSDCLHDLLIARMSLRIHWHSSLLKIVSVLACVSLVHDMWETWSSVFSSELVMSKADGRWPMADGWCVCAFPHQASRLGFGRV